MNNHTRRLVTQIHKSLLSFKDGYINPYGLLANVEGNLGAIEEKEIYEKLKCIINIVEDAIWIYDEEEGRNTVIREIKNIESMLDT